MNFFANTVVFVLNFVQLWDACEAVGVADYHSREKRSLHTRTHYYLLSSNSKQTPDHRRHRPVRAIASDRIRLDSRREPAFLEPIIACGLSLQLSLLASVENLAYF